MAETDPFGRAPGEDPLAAMGWSGSAGIDATAASDVASPEQPDQAARREARAERVALKAGGGRPSPPEGATLTGVPTDRLRRRGAAIVRRLAVLAVVIAVFAVAVPAALNAIDAVESEIDEAIPTLPSGPAGERRGDRERDRPSTPARPPSGLERASLLRRGNLAPALRRLRRVTGSSRVSLIRIDARQVIVTAPLPGGRTRLAEATWRGDAKVLSTSSGGSGGTSFAWSQVDASAPNRIVRVATRGGSSRTFQYLVLLDAAGLRWSAFVKGGAIYSASPDGSAVTRVGG